MYTLFSQVIYAGACALINVIIAPYYLLLAQIGYIRSWSAYATYREKNPASPDPLVSFKDAYKNAFGFKSDEKKTTVVWPLFVILAKGPKPVT